MAPAIDRSMLGTSESRDFPGMHEAAMAIDQLRQRSRGRRDLGRGAYDCDLEVVINEEHTFILSKKPLTSFSARIARLLSGGKAIRGAVKRQRITLDNFPGGSRAFEACCSFCYSGGRSQQLITHSNVAVLRAAAEDLEMSEAQAPENLISRTELFLSAAWSWAWPDLLTALRGCGTTLHESEKLHTLHCISTATAAAICSKSPGLISDDSDSVDSHGSNSGASSSSTTWWFSDISALCVYLMESVIRSLLKLNVDHRYLSRFLVYFLRSRLDTIVLVSRHQRPEVMKREQLVSGHSGDEFNRRVQREMLEMVVSLMGQLEMGAVSCRSLFAMLRMAVGVEASKACRVQIEKMIGVQLHNVTLDSVIVSSSTPSRYSGSVYDVDLVIRLIWYFVKEHMPGNQCSLGQVPVFTVGRLVDRYLVEISPDPHLHPSKFLRLARTLPGSARLTDDYLYKAVDLYLEAHPFVRKSEARSLCEVVNYQRLSMEACTHISQNPRFPAPLAVRALMAQRELLQKENRRSSTGGNVSTENGNKGNQSGNGSKLEAEGSSSNCNSSGAIKQRQQQPVTHKVREVLDRKSLSENDEIKLGLKDVQSRINNLEKMCKTARTEVVDSIRVKRLIC